MITKSLDMLSTKFQKTLSNRNFPECGAEMEEIEWRKEDGCCLYGITVAKTIVMGNGCRKYHGVF